jgi:hypothetical protein
MDDRRSAPATERNREPLLAVIRRFLPAKGLVLEVASGTGEHIVHFARALPALDWQPSDPDAGARASIAAWTSHHGARNVLPPLSLDAEAKDWPLNRADALLCVNMVHISPWRATEGLMRGAARLLPPQAPLILYGPYRRHGKTARSNLAFDATLRASNPDWGVRELDDVIGEANRHHFSCREMVEMPANNLTLIFSRD